MKKDKSWLGDMPKIATPSQRLRAAAKDKADARQLALMSANNAGYRRGRDDRERELNTTHNNAINVLRNQVATIQMDTVAIMDREFAKGFLATLAASNQFNPTAEVSMVSIRMANAIARELTRAYDKEKQA